MAEGTMDVAALDEEEEDEDYVPEEEEEEEEEDGSQVETTTVTYSCILSAAKRKAVDEAFEELFGYPFGTRFQPKRRKRTPRFDLLAKVFGESTAAQIMATSHTVRHETVQRAPRPDLSAPKTITEMKQFAGKNILVERKADSVKKKPSDGSPPKGIDSLLKQLSGPSQLSTVAKTSSDWDTFKTEAGMEEQLEQQAQGKNAFLVKKDFLNRVDGRRFEHERTQREQERTKRGK